MNNCELCINEAIVRSASNPSTKERIEHVLSWRESKQFDNAEETALELTEVITTLNSRYDSVSDELWLKVETFFGEKERAALVFFISVMNMFTRINVATRQSIAEWT